jgi:hypothetical protein
MTTSQKILIAAAVIVLLAFMQIGIAEQLVQESNIELFSLRSPLLIAMSAVQVVFGAWALTDVSKKIEEDKKAEAHKPQHTPTKHVK